MKKTMSIVFMTLMLNPLIASADQRSYDALSANVGKVFNGRNSAGHTCAAAVSDSGMTVNFDGTQLYEGIGMSWNELSKGWLSVEREIHPPTFGTVSTTMRHIC